ncbi:MAG: leucyl/phenylalanyl-tRNA--protein transferase [Myxococcales bacterium]|nr:leucyl/phenylalanyl-tRNA--protein transferase [Myxococcales bacterium]USN51465.1 MAG: leucyl/phenylalanyl-tRNA--protein transferase [Myxococcales bacterium]
MPVFLDETNILFPDHSHADEHGILAVGANLEPDTLLAAYYNGIFPWPHPGLPLLWFSPDPRFVMRPQDILINRSLIKAIKNSSLQIKADCNFYRVMKGCQKSLRAEQDGTWITNELIEGYCDLHGLGYAHSIEAYQDGRLVGGLYGVSIGSLFFGESMFFLQSNASKIAFATLVAHLITWNFSLIDCQSHTQHLEKFGAQPIKRNDFLYELEKSHQHPTMQGPWRFTMTPQQALETIKKASSLRKNRR